MTDRVVKNDPVSRSEEGMEPDYPEHDRGQTLVGGVVLMLIGVSTLMLSDGITYIAGLLVIAASGYLFSLVWEWEDDDA
jgi:hypothetical protein